MTTDASIDIGSLLTKTPGVQGGRPCIAGTRVPVHEIALMHRDGASVHEIADQFLVPVSHVHAAVAYYLVNRAQIDAEVAEDIELYRKLARSTRHGSVVTRTRGVFRSGRPTLTPREPREAAEQAFVDEAAERSGIPHVES